MKDEHTDLNITSYYRVLANRLLYPENMILMFTGKQVQIGPDNVHLEIEKFCDVDLGNVDSIEFIIDGKEYRFEKVNKYNGQ